MSVQRSAPNNPKGSKGASDFPNLKKKQKPVRGFSCKIHAEFHIGAQGLKRESSVLTFKLQDKGAVEAVVAIQRLQLKHDHVPERLSDIEGHNNVFLLARCRRATLQHKWVSRKIAFQGFVHSPTAVTKSSWTSRRTVRSSSLKLASHPPQGQTEKRLSLRSGRSSSSPTSIKASWS